jgi:uncharacterized repeat protein (TIGR03943 family)
MTRKTLIAVVLTAWGVFLAWFAATDTMVRFLGPRTYWVAWFGAVGLLIAGTMSLLGMRGGGGRAATRGDVAGAVLMVVPIVLVVVLPDPQLGAQAASRKAAGVGALSSFIPPPSRGGEIGLQQLHYASLSVGYADSLGITEGMDVDLVGFVTHPSGVEAGNFGLTRFYISCCAADAVPYTVIVRPGTGEMFSDDTWLRVEGTLARVDDRYVLEPTQIENVQEPSAPYLY